MKKILLLVILIAGLYGYGQDCNYKINEIDKFTKKMVKQTRPKVLFMGFTNQYNVWVKKVDNNRYLAIRVVEQHAFSALEGSELFLLKDNNETITLYSFSYMLSECKKGCAGDIYYKIPDDVFEELKNSTIKSYRIYLIDSYIEKDLVEGKQNIFKEILPCIE